MKKPRLSAINALFALLTVVFAPLAGASESDDKIFGLSTDLTKEYLTPEAQFMAVWLPTEFWKVTITVSAGMTAERRKTVIDTLDKYTVFMVAKMYQKDGVTTGFAPLEEVAKDASVISGSGKTLSPLAEEKITPEARELLAKIGPGLAITFGPLAEGLRMLVFPATGTDGKPLGDPKASGKLSLTMSGRTFSWHLPLGALMPPKTCPKCGENFKGDFRFCPYDGTALK